MIEFYDVYRPVPARAPLGRHEPEPPRPTPRPTPQADKIETILKAAGVTVEPYWPSLFAKVLETKDIGDLITNVGAGAPAAGGAAPAAGGDAAAPAEAAAPAPESEEEEMELDLFG